MLYMPAQYRTAKPGAKLITYALLARGEVVHHLTLRRVVSDGVLGHLSVAGGGSVVPESP